jgi:molecular chaperone Hsp33
VTDHILRALVRDGSARVVAVLTTDTAREAARRHGAVAGAAVALARGMSAGLLLATLTKGGERVTLQIIGDGPIGGVTVDAGDDGGVRAYLRTENALAPAGGGRRARLADALGRRGMVSVVRDLGLKEKYSGQSTLTTGEIDEDVEHYLRVSEQIDSALGCEAELGPGMEIVASCGVLVQCMPGSDGAPLVREAQHRLRTGVLYRALAAAAGGEALDADFLARAVVDVELDVLDVRPVRFHCPCSMERVARTLSLLGDDDLAALVAEAKPALVMCNFCGESYEVPLEDLVALQEKRGPHGAS